MSRYGSFPEPDSLAPPAAPLFKAWLERYGISKRSMSRRLGKSQPYVHLILNGRSTPHLEVAAAIEDLTGIPARLWVRGREEDTSGISLHRATGFDVSHAKLWCAVQNAQAALRTIEQTLALTDQPID